MLADSRCYTPAALPAFICHSGSRKKWLVNHQAMRQLFSLVTASRVAIIGKSPHLWPKIVHSGPAYRFSYPVRADSRFAPTQWETALLCNGVSQWLCVSLEPALSSNIHIEIQVSIGWYMTLKPKSALVDITAWCWKTLRDVMKVTASSLAVYLKHNFLILMQISFKFILQGSIDNKSALVQAMDCRRTGNKSALVQAMVWRRTGDTDPVHWRIYMRHYRRQWLNHISTYM